MKFRLTTTNKGQSMVEVTLAIGVAAVMIVGLVRVVTNAIYSTTFARQQAQATKYAQEELEWLRSERDKDWDLFYTNTSARDGSGYCMGNLVWTGAVPNESSATPCGANVVSGTEFSRWIIVSVITVDKEVSVTAKVRWTDSKGSHTSVSSGSLTNWRVQ